MEQAIKHHFNQSIVEKIKLPNGWKDNWLLVLSDKQKVVFRACRDYGERFQREKFFYDNVNLKLGKVCPEVYVVDGTCQFHDKAFQISEYLEGKPLNICLQEDFNASKKREMYYRIGEIAARINNIEISPSHSYVQNESWESRFAGALQNRLYAIAKNNLVTTDEADAICQHMRNAKAARTLSFTHCDIRPQNMIYCAKEDKIFVIDAEECEFGDPLNEMALLGNQWKMWEMFDCVLSGYRSVLDINLDNTLYYFYQLCDLAMILDMHFNYDCKNDWTQLWIEMFHNAKSRALFC